MQICLVWYFFFVKGILDILTRDSETYYTIVYTSYFSKDFLKLFYEIPEISIIKALTTVYNYKEIADFRTQLKLFIR